MLPTERPDQADTQQWQLASLVVYCRPDAFTSAKDALQSYAGVELHTDDGSGKLILTIEAQSSRQLAETMDAMRLVNGVMSLQMVYHQLDDDDGSMPASDPSHVHTDSPDLVARPQEAS